MRNRIKTSKSLGMRLLFAGVVFFAGVETGHGLCDDVDCQYWYQSTGYDAGNCPYCGVCFCGAAECEYSSCPGDCTGAVCSGCPVHETCSCNPE